MCPAEQLPPFPRHPHPAKTNPRLRRQRFTFNVWTASDASRARVRRVDFLVIPVECTMENFFYGVLSSIVASWLWENRHKGAQLIAAVAFALSSVFFVTGLEVQKWGLLLLS